MKLGITGHRGLSDLVERLIRERLAAEVQQAHMAGSEILVGLVDRLVAVWDGKPARDYGGTADVVGYARRMGVPVDVVWPAGASRD
ncbi:hypothetical protein ABT381_05625 [Streptomyces sp. NPDC000151]|uniref:hypothetical protein n=1 Tax=Streptomyces sp. NPDC000151 TaxID=3154244 RepID=UPI003321D82F